MKDNNSEAERFLSFRDELGFDSDKNFAKALNLGDDGVISRIRSGKKNVPYTAIKVMANKWSVNPDYIATGRLPRYVETEDTDIFTKFKNSVALGKECYLSADRVMRNKMEIYYAKQRLEIAKEKENLK